MLFASCYGNGPEDLHSTESDGATHTLFDQVQLCQAIPRTKVPSATRPLWLLPPVNYTPIIIIIANGLRDCHVCTLTLEPPLGGKDKLCGFPLVQPN